MKGRPRRIENRVAEEMSKFYESIDMSPVVRIPVTGRTGPDISLNEMKLAIDVKSRKSCPIKIRPNRGELTYVRHPHLLSGTRWVGCQIQDLASIKVAQHFSHDYTLREVKPSKMIQNWLDHMDEWSQQQYITTQDEGLISALVIHNPGNQVKSAVLIVKQWEVFHDRVTNRTRN